MARQLTDKQKAVWLSRYDNVIRKALKNCTKRPDWQHWPHGHLNMNRGSSPEAAARRYLQQTVYGKQSCARFRRAR